jgi:hypothetical protein
MVWLQLELRAEESRLKFQAKRANIQRQRRVAQHEEYLAGLAQEEKDRRLDMLLAGKRAMRLGRKAMAQDFAVAKQSLAREVAAQNETLRREAYNAEQRRLLEASLHAQQQPGGAGGASVSAAAPLPVWRGQPAGGGRRSAAF